MQLSAVLMARYIAFFETIDLNPRGRHVFPNLTNTLVTKYRFMKYPQSLEEYDNKKGIEYLSGKWDKIAIDKLALHPNGIVVETRSSTNDAEKFLDEVLTWAAEMYELKYQRGMIKRKGYVSELTFTTDVTLNALNPKLTVLAQKLSNSVSANIKIPISFEASGINFYFETAGVSVPSEALRIERRESAAFSENKYFSSAPLPTDDHIQFLEDFEAALKG
jgi:hypothetical protein